MEIQEIVNNYVNSYEPGNHGNRFRLYDEMILNDERIRRIILTNFDNILEFEMKQGKRQKNRLYEYRANKYDVWRSSASKTSKYLSVSQIVVYLAFCGYKLDYIIEPV